MANGLPELNTNFNYAAEAINRYGMIKRQQQQDAEAQQSRQIQNTLATQNIEQNNAMKVLRDKEIESKLKEMKRKDVIGALSSTYAVDDKALPAEYNKTAEWLKSNGIVVPSYEDLGTPEKAREVLKKNKALAENYDKPWDTPFKGQIIANPSFDNTKPVSTANPRFYEASGVIGPDGTPDIKIKQPYFSPAETLQMKLEATKKKAASESNINDIRAATFGLNVNKYRYEQDKDVKKEESDRIKQLRSDYNDSLNYTIKRYDAAFDPYKGKNNPNTRMPYTNPIGSPQFKEDVAANFIRKVLGNPEEVARRPEYNGMNYQQIADKILKGVSTAPSSTPKPSSQAKGVKYIDKKKDLKGNDIFLLEDGITWVKVKK
jgi:hypothetical protein